MYKSNARRPYSTKRREKGIKIGGYNLKMSKHLDVKREFINCSTNKGVEYGHQILTKQISQRYGKGIVKNKFKLKNSNLSTFKFNLFSFCQQNKRKLCNFFSRYGS
jgi:hypothetical protein